MRALLQDIVLLWQRKLSFRLALSYLVLLFALILILPILPLPFLPNQMDLENVFLKPFVQSNHMLGTDQLGRDVLTNTLYGARNGLMIALPVMLISSLIGTTTGAIAGYFGNYKLQLKRATLALLLLCLALLFYYCLYIPIQVIQADLPASILYTSVGVGTGLSMISWFGIGAILNRLPFLSKKAAFPIDGIMLRLIELITSLPKLLILITVAAFAPPSVMLLSAIFVCTYWTGTARLARAEMLRIKQLPYLEAAISAGMSNSRIILKQAVPNLLSPVVVAFVFGVAGLLAIESTLSFLGIGLPATFPSWGRTIAGIRTNLSAWWLVVFPGGLLALTVLALQVFSYNLVRITQERGKQ